MSDKTLTCVECNTSFTFSAEDQAFHAQKGYTDPKRCPTCRSARRGSGGGSYGSSRAPRQMYQVVCAECKKDTEVPFLPSGDRPVYCSDCFSKRPAATNRW
jgi:CxxC-x17-CxxC domain-containing protein